MHRQNLRKLILIISLFLFSITIWHMSPYLLIQGAIEGIVSGSFIVFVCRLSGFIFWGEFSAVGFALWELKSLKWLVRDKFRAWNVFSVALAE